MFKKILHTLETLFYVYFATKAVAVLTILGMDWIKHILNSRKTKRSS